MKRLQPVIWMKGTFLSPGDKIDAEIAGIGKLSIEIKPPL